MRQIRDLKGQLLHELYMLKLFPMYEKLEDLIKKLPPEELYDDIDDMPLINIAILQDNAKLFEIIHKYQPATKRLTVFIAFDRMDLFYNSFLKLEPKESIDFYSKDEYLLTYPIDSAIQSKFAITWFRIFKELGMDFNHKYEPYGETCMHMVQKLTDLVKIKTLMEFLVMECGADINVQENIFQMTPLMTSPIISFHSHSFLAASSLLESFLKLGANLDIKDRRGNVYLDYFFLRHGTVGGGVGGNLNSLVFLLLQGMYNLEELSTKSYFPQIEMLIQVIVEKRRACMFDFLFF